MDKRDCSWRIICIRKKERHIVGIYIRRNRQPRQQERCDVQHYAARLPTKVEKPASYPTGYWRYCCAGCTNDTPSFGTFQQQSQQQKGHPFVQILLTLPSANYSKSICEQCGWSCLRKCLEYCNSERAYAFRTKCQQHKNMCQHQYQESEHYLVLSFTCYFVIVQNLEVMDEIDNLGRRRHEPDETLFSAFIREEEDPRSISSKEDKSAISFLRRSTLV